MDSTRNLARRAGLLYVLASSAAPFAYLYVPQRVFLQGDPQATAERVRAAEGLLRASIVAELFGATVLILAGHALYRLFKSVDEELSTLMAALILVSVPISYANALSHIAPLVLVQSPAFAGALESSQTAAQVTLFLRLHAYGLFVNQILWGLWLFPIGLLVMRSGFIPRWFAFPLFFAGAGYVLNSLGMLLLPTPLRWITGSLQVLGVGEMPLFNFYLLIWGVRGRPVDRLSAFLALTFFTIGTGAIALLLLRRIDAVQYAAFALASLVVALGMVLRWRIRP